MPIRKSVLLVLFVLFAAASCGGPSALQQIKEKLEPYPQYSVVLKDMRSQGLFFHDYFQKYQLIYPEKGTQTGEGKPDFKKATTEWIKVDKSTYNNYRPCLGMTILGKAEDGEVENICQPIGYQYVGDTRYGHWETDNRGNRFWEWYGKYHLLAEVVDEIGDLAEKRYRVKHKDWERYKKRKAKKAPYFGKKGKSGKPRYGTQGTVTKKINTDFFKRQQARMQAKKASFTEKVKSRMGRTRVSSVRSRSTRSGK